MKIALVALCCFLSFSLGVASAPLIKFAIGGFGASASCGAFVLAENQPALSSRGWEDEGTTWVPLKTAYEQYANGFITRSNLARAEKGLSQVTADDAGVMLWLRNYCNENPTTPFLSALFALTR